MLLRNRIVEKQGQEQKRTDRRKTGVINGPAVTGGGFGVFKFVAAPGGSDVNQRSLAQLSSRIQKIAQARDGLLNRKKSES